MAGEQEYIHPIIQAMIASHQLAQGSQHLKQQAEAEKNRKELEQQRIDQEKTRIENEHEYHKSLVENATQLLHAHLGQARNEAIKELQGMSSSGIDISKISPGTPQSNLPNMGNIPMTGELAPEQTINLPDLGINNVPVSAFASPEKVFALRAKGIGLQKTAELGAEQPFIEKGQEFLEGQQGRLLASQVQREQETRKSAEKIAEGNNRSAELRARIAANAHINGLKMGEMFDPDSIQNGVNDIYITGNTTQYPTKMRQAILNAAPAGYTPIDKKDTPILDQIPKIEKTLDIANQLTEFSRNSNLGSTIGGAFGFGDAARLKNELTGVAGNIAETFGKEVGRKSEGDIQRAVKLLYSPTLTKAENQKNVTEAEQIFKSTLQPILGKYQNQEQLNAILSNRGIDPSRYITPSKPSPTDKLPKSGKTKSAILLDDGTTIPDTPENRQLHGLPKE